MSNDTQNYEGLLQAYKYPYNVFNLNFIERLIRPFCLSEGFDTLTVLLLECSVGLLPFVMIVLAILILKFKECCCINIHHSKNQNVMNFIKKWSGRIENALLPSFASFLLLSYTKFNIVSATLVQKVEINGEKRPYLAAQYSEGDAYYIQLIPGVFILCTFTAITPILLLDFPLRAVEWIVGKSIFLTRIYPATKIHILLDTFQGCYKKNTRFFAGIYFLFRVVVNLAFVLSSSWIESFVINQVTVTAIIILLVCLKPYRPELNYVNYVDIFIFSTLAFLNCFTFFLFVTYKIDPEESDAKYQIYFYIQYAAIFLPLIYMIAFLFWKNKGVKKILLTLSEKLQCTRASKTGYKRLASEEDTAIQKIKINTYILDVLKKIREKI